MPLQWQNILTLGGLRGGIAVALVLSLPTEYEFKSLSIALIILVIAINLVVNSIFLDRYMKKSKIGQEKNVFRYYYGKRAASTIKFWRQIRCYLTPFLCLLCDTVR